MLPRAIPESLAVAGACLIFASGCAAAPPGVEEIIVGANHPHSVDILTVTVNGIVPELRKKIGVTAKFSETEPRLDGLYILYPQSKTIVVPRSYFEKIELPQERSLSLGYIVGEDSKAIGKILVFLDYGHQRRSADLKCTNDLGDPLYKSFTLAYDPHARTFESSFQDYCGEPIPG